MVGDGINDAPALVQADLSFAVHSGSHLGKDAANITLMRGNPVQVLDYLSLGKLESEQVAEIIQGIGEGCRQANCALLGGETAEMPGFYQDNEYDMAGFAVGIVDNSKIIDGTEVRVGHRLIGIASSGLHSNGYSLVRKICFDRLKLKIDDYVPELGETIGEALLRPTKIYVEPLLSILKDLPVHGLAHITGGGIEDNLLRIVPEACNISIQGEIWDVPPIFSFLQQAGKVSDAEMRRTFNNGIGMIAVVPADAAADVLQRLEAMNEKAYLIGEIMECKKAGERITWE